MSPIVASRPKRDSSRPGWPSVSASSGRAREREGFVRRACRLEWAGIAWITIEAAEYRARRIAEALLYALATYVVLAAALRLRGGHGASFSWLGIVIALLTMPVMAWLARAKRAVATALESRAMRADATESIACGWLSLAVVAGLLANAFLGRWWIDPAASLVIVPFLLHEAPEAWAAQSPAAPPFDAHSVAGEPLEGTSGRGCVAS
jgi:hypothetical protein